MPATWQHAFLSANGIRFHYVTQGQGDLILLLHGFPEFWYSWRHQIPPLAQNFRVVAIDLRGYNDSDKRGPYNTESAFSIGTLTTDVREIVHALGYERAHIVAHDWTQSVTGHFSNRPQSLHTT